MVSACKWTAGEYEPELGVTRRNVLCRSTHAREHMHLIKRTVAASTRAPRLFHSTLELQPFSHVPTSRPHCHQASSAPGQAADSTVPGPDFSLCWIWTLAYSGHAMRSEAGRTPNSTTLESSCQGLAAVRRQRVRWHRQGCCWWGTLRERLTTSTFMNFCLMLCCAWRLQSNVILNH